MIGKNCASLVGGNRGNVEADGVIHIGLSGRGRIGSEYEDS